MGATHAALAGGLLRRRDGFIVTLDPAFQGPPETAHGGTVLAAFHLASGADGSAVRGVYRRRVPIATPLRLTLSPDRGRVTCVLEDDAGALVEGSVTPPGASHSASRDDPGRGSAADSHPVPLSGACVAGRLATGP